MTDTSDRPPLPERPEDAHLLSALKLAVETIRALHGIGLLSGPTEEEVWALYQQSPEMRAITAAIAKAERR